MGWRTRASVWLGRSAPFRRRSLAAVGGRRRGRASWWLARSTAWSSRPSWSAGARAVGQPGARVLARLLGRAPTVWTGGVGLAHGAPVPVLPRHGARPHGAPPHKAAH